MAEIKGIANPNRVQLDLPEAGKPQQGTGFKDTLKAALDGVDHLQKEADRTATDVVTGKKDNVHQAMVAMEKADVSFKLMLEARNRIVKAYEEIMKANM